MAGTLYIVATPIGNLRDISGRALETLDTVKKIYAEDTRVARKLINYFEVKTPLDSYHQHSNKEKKLNILNELLSGDNIALITDAGTPGVSDPGNELIDFLYSSGNVMLSEVEASVSKEDPSAVLGMTSQIQIIPIPGPSAVTAALSVCGFDVSKYLFIGFWPKKKGKKVLEMVQGLKVAVVFFESPYRIKNTLEKLSDALGKDKRVFIGREITKKFETHYRGSISEVIRQIEKERKLKGEIVVVIEA